MTLMQVGFALGTSQANVCRHELGQIGLSVESAIRYADLYGVSLDWLLRGQS